MRLIFIYFFAICTSAIFFWGCSSNDFTQPTLLDDLRVLTVAVDQPEVSDTGSTVTVTPYITDINGSGRVISYQAIACTEPGIASGADANCDSATDRTVIVDGSYDPASATTDMVAPSYTGALPSFAVTVPSGFLSDKSTLEQSNGASYMIEVNITAGGVTATAIKRITVSQRTTLNSNPSIQSVEWNSSALTQGDSFPGAGQVKAVVDASNKESYDILSSDGRTVTATESLTTRYFSSNGEFSVSATDVDTASEYTPTTPNPSVIAVLVTDGRGGSSIQIFTF